MDKRKIVKICLVLFAISAGVRLLVWQNNKLVIEEPQWVLADIYKLDARLLVAGDLKTFLTGNDPPSDTTIIMHPPGYPIFLASVYSLFGETDIFRVVQILFNSLAPVIIFLTGLILLDYRTAIISALLAIFLPQSAYYAATPLPDGLSVVPILFALYIFSLNLRRGSLVLTAMCGAALGVSCWLRSNAMLLPLFFIFFGAILWPKGTRVRQSLTLFLAFVFVIAPLTIRNFVVFHAFVPISSAGGHNFIAGLADYDAEGKFGLSVLDVDAAKQEAEMYGRPDYGVSQYSPDGIQREKDRYRRGIKIVIENPVWYFRSVIHRALTYSLRFERVPVIAPGRDERANTIPILYILNIPLKAFQRLFITAILTPLMLGGIIILFRRKEKRKVLLVLLIVPVYYACIQSLLHTEYRYVLPATHVVIMFSAVALSYLLGMVLKLLAKTPDTNNPQINAD